MGCHPSHWRTHIFQRGGSTTQLQCFKLLISPLKIVIFLSYVSLPEGTVKTTGWFSLEFFFFSDPMTEREWEITPKLDPWRGGGLGQGMLDEIAHETHQ